MTNIKEDDIKFLDTIDLICQFTDKLELAVNKPSYEFLDRRMDFLDEEVEELREGILDKDDLEIIDGAADVAFIAITQIYLGYRNLGVDHPTALVKTRATLILVGRANLTKNIPTKPGDKITKPEGWKSPNGKIKEFIHACIHKNQLKLF